jgi:hypothetical protein
MADHFIWFCEAQESSLGKPGVRVYLRLVLTGRIANALMLATGSLNSRFGPAEPHATIRL